MDGFARVYRHSVTGRLLFLSVPVLFMVAGCGGNQTTGDEDVVTDSTSILSDASAGDAWLETYDGGLRDISQSDANSDANEVREDIDQLDTRDASDTTDVANPPDSPDAGQDDGIEPDIELSDVVDASDACDSSESDITEVECVTGPYCVTDGDCPQGQGLHCNTALNPPQCQLLYCGNR